MKISAAVVVVVGLLYQASAFAAPTENALAGTLVFPTNNEFIVVNRSGVQVCNHLNANWTCTLAPGKYRWRDLTAAEEDYFYALNRNITQGAFPTEHPEPPGSVLPTTSFGALSSADVAAMIDAVVDALVIPTNQNIDDRAYAVFQANCTVTP